MEKGMCFRSGFISLALVLSALLSRGQSVDLLTGNLQFGIPLGAVAANDVSVPVGISQHGNALSVPEGEGDCGMGWSLSAGGAITRLVRGLPDELDLSNRKGWIKMSTQHASIQNFSPAGNDTLDPCSDEASDFTFLDGLAYTFDTEPDLFFFHAPGISGQFILSSNGTPQLLSLQDLTISTFRSDSFSIKTNLGIVYSFSIAETSTRNAGGYPLDNSEYQYNATPDEIQFTSRWLLKRIESTATGTTANLTYTTLPEVTSFSYKEDSLFYIYDKFQPRRLSAIEVKSYRAEFTWANHVVSKVKFLDTISGKAKTYELYYRTFKDYKYHATNYPYPVAKSFLYKVREVSPDCSPFTSYEFTYQGVNWDREALAKPWRKNSKLDWFGYLTGRSGLSRPTVYFYDGDTDERRVRMVNQGGGNLSHTFSGSDRSINTDSVGFGSLIKVITPAGGIVEITWEPNKYYDSALLRSMTGGGVRVKKIAMNGSDVAYGKPTDSFSPYRGITRSYEYKESNDSSSGKLLSPLKYGYYTATSRFVRSTSQGDPSDIMYARVKETVDTLGYTIYEFSIPGVFPQTQKYEWKATKSRIARKSGTDCGYDNYRNGSYAYPFPPSTNFGHRRGFLKAVYQYSNSNTLVRKREMTALQLPASPPAAVKAIRFEKVGANIFYYGIYEILTGRAQVVGSEKVTEYPESGSTPIVTTTKYTYNANHMVSQVTDTLADGSLRVRNMKYAKDYNSLSGTPSQPSALALKTLNDTHRHGELIEQTTQVTPAGGSAVLIDASFVAYKTFVNNKVLPAYLLSVPRGVSVTLSSANASTLTVDTDYDTVRIFNDYDSEGRILWESDKKKNKVAHSYATQYGYEEATFSHVAAGMSVHEGFETNTTAGLTASGGSLVSGWTGQKARTITAGVTLTSGSLSKGTATRFRLSCWAKASSAVSVYFKADNGTSYDIGTLSVDNSNQWKYYEAVVTPASVPTSYVLKVTSSGSVSLDDVLFMPAEARVGLQTVMPMAGVTSSTDDRGNSVAFTYDTLGRKTGVFDRKRNLVQKLEYNNQKTLVQQLSAGFTTDATEYKVGTAITFTALQYCNAGSSPTYQWTVDGTAESTSSALTKTFTVPGRHNISLSVAKSGLETAVFNQDICFNYAGPLSVSAVDGESIEYESGFTANCVTPQLTLTAENVPASGGGCTTTVEWEHVGIIEDDGVYFINLVQELGSGTTVNFTPRSAATIRVTVATNCTNGNDLACLGNAQNFVYLWFQINYDPTVPCP